MRQFRLRQMLLAVLGFGVLFASGRFLGIQFVCYMTGVIGFLAAPALARDSGSMGKLVMLLAALAWLLVWILLAGLLSELSVAQ